MPLGEVENHPYLNYLGDQPDYQKFTSLIIGSFPIYPLTNSIAEEYGIKLRQDWLNYADLTFFYGSKENNFWKWFLAIYVLEKPKVWNHDVAIKILEKLEIVITDAIKSCQRNLYSASDNDLKGPFTYYLDILNVINNFSGNHIYFTATESGKPFTSFKSILRSKNEVFYFEQIGNSRNKSLFLNGKEYKPGFLYSPSPSGNRTKNKNPDFNNYQIRTGNLSYEDFVFEQWKQLLLKKNFEYDGSNPID